MLNKLKTSSYRLPLLYQKVSAGFPNPCSEFISKPISLDELLITRPSSTFMIRVDGLSMTPTIPNGAILIVDKSVHATTNSIVVAIVDGEFIVKELLLSKNAPPILHSHNPDYKDIIINERNQDVTEIWGVVTSYIKQL
jgi:DNA polymerase V